MLLEACRNSHHPPPPFAYRSSTVCRQPTLTLDFPWFAWNTSCKFLLLPVAPTALTSDALSLLLASGAHVSRPSPNLAPGQLFLTTPRDLSLTLKCPQLALTVCRAQVHSWSYAAHRFPVCTWSPKQSSDSPGLAPCRCSVSLGDCPREETETRRKPAL